MPNNVITSELESTLQELATGMGLSVKEYVESLGYATVEELQESHSNLQEQITAIVELDATNGAVSLAEKIAEIDAVISDETGAVQNILSKILENKQAILDEVLRATQAEADLQSQITANDSRITSVVESVTTAKSEAIQTANDYTDTKASEIEQAIENLRTSVDERELQLSSIDVCGIGNRFRMSLGLVNKVCDDAGSEDTGDGTVI